MDQQSTRMNAFLSLAWYETFLRFVSHFIARSSEILLTAGLVVSSANFLSDGSMLREGTPVAIAWAWTQAIAIDGSLGVSFYTVFQSLKKHDWVKFVLYSILTLLLTLVAWFITEGDIFSHAVNASNQESMRLLGIDTRILSTLRAIAVVGFVLMGRLKDDTLQGGVEPTVAEKLPEKGFTNNAFKQGDIESSAPQVQTQLTPADIECIIQRLLQSNHLQTIVTEETPLQEKGKAVKAIPEGTNHEKETDHEIISFTLASSRVSIENEDRLLQAYQELLDEKQNISGRTLAQRAHIRRATCTRWLQNYQQKAAIDQSSEGAGSSTDQSAPVEYAESQ